MSKWNFKVASSPKEVLEKLRLALGSKNGLVFDTETTENDSVIFNMRKRLLYPSQLFHVNRISVNGKILNAESGSDIEVSFAQNIFIKLIIFTHMFLGLGVIVAIFTKFSSSTPMYIIGGLLLAIGFILWITVQSKFEKNIQEYKNLISGVLAPEQP